jgi:hypothetical protein
MVSRRKILSRSRDELHSDVFSRIKSNPGGGLGGGGGGGHSEEDDVWSSKEKLFQVGI